jgi:hypothetical protein
MAEETLNIWYRGVDPRAPVQSAEYHLMAAAARCFRSITRAFDFLWDHLNEALKEAFTADTLWTLCLIVAGWLIVSVLSGPIGTIVNGILLIYGLIEIWDRLSIVSESLAEWAKGWYYAKNDVELDLAARNLERFISVTGITLFEVIILHKAFTKLRTSMAKRFKTPPKLREEFDEGLKRNKARDRVKQAARGAASVAVGLGANTAARKVSEIPVIPVLVGVVTVVAVGAAATAALSAGSEPRSIED